MMNNLGNSSDEQCEKIDQKNQPIKDAKGGNNAKSNDRITSESQPQVDSERTDFQKKKYNVNLEPDHDHNKNGNKSGNKTKINTNLSENLSFNNNNLNMQLNFNNSGIVKNSPPKDNHNIKYNSDDDLKKDNSHMSPDFNNGNNSGNLNSSVSNNHNAYSASKIKNIYNTYITTDKSTDCEQTPNQNSNDTSNIIKESCNNKDQKCN